MKKVLLVFYKVVVKLKFKILLKITNALTNFLFNISGVEFISLNSSGIPILYLNKGGEFKIGKNFRLNNMIQANPIGRVSKCTFFIKKDATLSIGNNVGISSSSIVCHKKIEIEDNVKIGGNTVIYDTDFHSLNHEYRISKDLDNKNTISKPVKICKNVFIGAHSTILKGVTIGENSIIGACSVVSKSIPSNEIWAGNPIKFIKKINDN